MAATTARLIIETGGHGPPSDGGAGTAFDLASGVATIGREPGNTIVLSSEPKASRHHCQVSRSALGFEIADLGSTNGTRVNGDPVKRRTLRHGDVIEVGLTRIRFDDESSAARDQATTAACFLEHTAGDRKGERIPLTGGRISLGRRETNTIVLEDRMASGHHAEVTKDVNGWTIRDLGSTNGTLVNGEPTTEALLTHGTRIRIGNARFVFKDPSMKDVEVELAGLEEDDAGWGMMAEIDLSRARGGGGGVVAALVLLLAVGGAAVWVMQRPTEEVGGPTADADNLVADGRFDLGDAGLWTVPEGEPLRAPAVVQKGRSGGGPALEIRHDGAAPRPGVVRYAEDVPVASTQSYTVSASVKRQGTAELAIQWIGRGRVRSGATAVTQTVRLGAPQGAGAWGEVKRTVWPPRWAEAATIAVRISPDSSATIDDVRLEKGALATAPRFSAGRSVEASVSSTGGVDLVKTATVLLVGATPVARTADGRVLGGASGFESSSISPTEDGARVEGKVFDAQGSMPATITWTRTAEGLVAKVTVEGAESVGLAADLPQSHLEAEGISALGAFAPARLEAKAGQTLDGVAKTLVGDPSPRVTGNPEKPGASGERPPTLLSFTGPEGASDLRLEVGESGDRDLLRIALWRKGAEAEFRILTDFDGERTKARAELNAALAQVARRPGEGIRRLREVAQSYPFDKEIRAEALKAAAEAEDRGRRGVGELDAARERAAVFGSEDAIAAAERLAADLEAQFPAGEGTTTSQIQVDVQALAAKVRGIRAKHDLARATPEVKRLMRLAQLLEQEPGFQALAAVYFRDIVRRFGSLETATEDGGEVAALVKDARARFRALEGQKDVKDALPRPPGPNGGGAEPPK